MVGDELAATMLGMADVRHWTYCEPRHQETPGALDSTSSTAGNALQSNNDMYVNYDTNIKYTTLDSF